MKMLKNKKGLWAISLIVVMFMNIIMPLTTFAASSQNINWESEPNDDIATANYLIPYSSNETLNQGHLTKSDIDVWHFYANKENYTLALQSPEGYFYDVVVWEKESNGNFKMIAHTDNMESIDYVTLPGVNEDGIVRDYYVVVHTDWSSSSEANEPYTLVLDDTN